MPRNNVTSKAKEVDRYFYDQADPRLRTYFGTVVKGQPNVYDTPFAKGESTQSLLDAWNEVLVSINNTWPTLYDFEEDMAAKVGPLSVMKPLSERMEDIEAYYSGILLPQKPLLPSAIAAVKSEWSVASGLRLRGYSSTIERMKLSTNSGSPYFSKRRRVIEEHGYPTIITINGKHLTLTADAGTKEICAVLGWRGQEGGYSKEDVKQRVVWMFPLSVNIEELRVYQPLIESAQRFNIVPAWVGMDEVDRRVTTMFDTKGSGDLVICTDFSKFDQHFNLILQDTAASILADVFTEGAINSWLRSIFPIKYEIPMMFNYGELKYGSHGMGSGSGGTNADETLAHRALQYEAALLNHQRLNPNSQCLGDDGILTYPGITVDQVVEAYSGHGLEMNTSKQYASVQDCVYLRRWHHKDYRVNGVCAGVYSTNRALGRLRYLERFMDPEFWGSKAVALRQLSILENVKYHPLRDQFAEFCMKRDKYRLGIDIPGFLDNIEGEVKEAIDHMPDLMGYTRTLQSEGDPTYGIKSWWIVKYLRSKR